MDFDDAQTWLQKGDTDKALSALQLSIKSHPSDGGLRVFLFQLLSVLGQWDRALNQLNVCAELDAAHLLMAQTYGPILQCERLRQEVLAGRQSPLILGDPEPWVAWLLEALRLDQAGEVRKAEDLRLQALDQAPAIPGTLDGKPFVWLADADTRFGPVIEAMINGRYYWVPLSRIRRIQLAKPEDLRDMVWLPAELTLTNGGDAFGFIPVRYPGSESGDALQQLARLTDWVPVEGGSSRGLGQRMLATDAWDYALLDCRSIEFETTDPGHG